MLTSVEVSFSPEPSTGVLRISTLAKCRDRTGVEMEALTAASVAALTVYDMVKAIDRAMIVEAIALEEKLGGRSGHWRRDDEK